MSKAQKPMRILFADDDPNMRRMVELYLRDSGIDIEFALDGKQALSKMGKTAFDMLFTDLQMPRMSGLDLIRELKNNDLPIVVISAFGKEYEVEEAVRNGASDVLSKPFTSVQLKEIIEKYS